MPSIKLVVWIVALSAATFVGIEYYKQRKGA